MGRARRLEEAMPRKREPVTVAAPEDDRTPAESPGTESPAAREPDILEQRAGQSVWYDVSRVTDDDLYLLSEGTHYRLYEKLGSHVMTAHGAAGVCFAVWAPD